MKKQNRNLPVEHYLVEAAAQELDEDCRVSLYEITCRQNSVMLKFFEERIWLFEKYTCTEGRV